MPPSLLTRTTEAALGLLDPWLFLSLSTSFIPRTVSHVLRTQDLSAALRTLLSPSRFRDAWFSQFWGYAGPGVREGAGPRVLPLLDGRTSKGHVLDSPTGPDAGVAGVVLEVGPGSGLWVDVFSDRHWHEDQVAGDGDTARRSQSSARGKITRVYGVEPNASHHAALRRAVEAAGLQDVYEIVPVGIEDLTSAATTSAGARKKWEGSIEPGSVDCVVTILCLCSIPDQAQHIRELYELLRPGGRWYVYEHVRCRYSWYMRAYQRMINLVWPYVIGGCEMCRETEKSLREAGPWTTIDIGQPPVEPWYHCLPHILGVFTK
ncbi:S-adenosyl-L-methionine-dependent methyltransferase [Nemania serpens]|nr:S-adenosyl-L-methionine-dependent methyltransferase [Nemania serpens]